MSKEDKHFPLLIIICFGISFVIGLTGGFYFESNLTVATYFWQISNLGYVAGCALLSLKAASENKHISATGFILLSIGMSTFFSLQTSLGEETDMAYVSGALITIPGLLFVCYYNAFPMWVRIFGVVSALPRVILIVQFYFFNISIERNGNLDGMGYLLTNIVGLTWAYFTYKNYLTTRIKQKQ